MTSGVSDARTAAFAPGNEVALSLNGLSVDYLGRDGKIKDCPSFKDYINSFEQGTGGYGYNEVYVGGRGDVYNVIGDPRSATESLTLNDHKAWSLSKLIMFADAGLPQGQTISEYPFLEPPFWESPPGTVTSSMTDPSVHFRHNGHANVIWCDGHASNEQMSFTVPLNIGYGGDNYKFKVGWFGPRTNNVYWRTD